MAIEFESEGTGFDARIKVIGVGGGGGNAINNMIQSGLVGVEFIAANTDAQALNRNLATKKIQIGTDITRGLGAGAKPEVGRMAAEESQQRIRDELADVDMVFITAGMGGGTGTGAAPVIARIARELGILTVAVVTRPFFFEGHRRMRLAEDGLTELRQYVDTAIVIPNEKLVRMVGAGTTMLESFRKADDVLYDAVRGITDLIMGNGLVNVDFADVRTVMSEMGQAMMAAAEASGPQRAVDAITNAISSPLLEDASIHGARSVLINIAGGHDFTLLEFNEAATVVRNMAHEDALIVVGMTIDPAMVGTVRVTVVATGINSGQPELVPASNVRAAGRVREAQGGIGVMRPGQPALGLVDTGRRSSRSDGMDMPPSSAHPITAVRPTRDRHLRTRTLDMERIIAIENGSADLDKPTFLRRQMD